MMCLHESVYPLSISAVTLIDEGRKDRAREIAGMIARHSDDHDKGR